MTISTITYKKYQTSDGTIFDTYEKAFKHENEEGFHQWYDDHELFGLYEGSKIDSDQMFKWITENEDFLYSFLNSRHLLSKKEE